MIILLIHFQQQDLELLYMHNNAKIFHPIKDPDLHWIQKSIVEALDLYFYKLLPLTDQSEADLLRRVWHFLEKCFDPVGVQVRWYVSFSSNVDYSLTWL